MPVIDALGSIASEFSKGFLQGRLLNAQKAIQAHTQNLEDVRALSEAADRFKDNPALQEQYLSQLHDALDKLPKPPKSAQQGGQSGGGGIKDFFSNMFSRKQAGPQAPAGTNPANLMPEADNESTGGNPTPLPPVSPGSQTFGAPAAMMMPPVPAAPTAAAAVPAAGQVPPPSTAGPAAQSSSAQPAASGFGSDVTFPSPEEADDFGLNNWYKDPKYGFVDPTTGVAKMPTFTRNDRAIADKAQQFAFAHAHTALNALDQHREQYNAQHPDAPIETEADLYSNPATSAEYRHVSEGIRAFENRKLIPASGPNGEKGTLDQWRQQFADVRPGYDKIQTERVAADRIRSKPESLRTPAEKAKLTGFDEGRKAEARDKWTPAEAEQGEVWDAYKTLAEHPQMAARPEQFSNSMEPVVQQELSHVRNASTTVSAYQNKLNSAERGKLNPDQQLQSDWMNAFDKNSPTASIDEKARQFVSRFHPPQPASFSAGTPQVNPANGKLEIPYVDPKDPTHLIWPGLVKTPEPNMTKFQTKIERGGSVYDPKAPNKTRLSYGEDVYDPIKVIQGYNTGELGGLEQLKNIAETGAFASAADKLKIDTFLREQQKPFGPK